MPKQTVPHFIRDDDNTNESLLIHDIARLSKLLFDRRVREIGLTRSQWLVLGMLRRNPGINQAQLAERLDVKPITITRTVERMEKAGWVERRHSATDRRAKQLFLTPRVQDVIAQMRALALETRQDILENVSPQEHQTLLSALHKMKQNVCHRNKVKP